MAAEGAIKLLKPDAQGIMAAVFGKFSSQGEGGEGTAILTFSSYCNLLAAVGLDASVAAAVVASGVFERLCRVEAALSGSGSATAPGVSFRVFPTLLSDTAVQVARAKLEGDEGYVQTAVSDTEARQTFMRKNVLPLHGKIVKENKEKGAAPPATPAAVSAPSTSEAAATAQSAPAPAPAPVAAPVPTPAPALEPVAASVQSPPASAASPLPPLPAPTPTPSASASAGGEAATPSPMPAAAPSTTASATAAPTALAAMQTPAAPPPPPPARLQQQQQQQQEQPRLSSSSSGFATPGNQHYESSNDAPDTASSRLLRPTASSTARSSSAHNLRARLSMQQQGQLPLPLDNVGADRDAGRRDSWMFLRPEGFYRVPDTEPDPSSADSSAAVGGNHSQQRRSTSRGHGLTMPSHHEEEGNSAAGWQDFLSRQQAAIEHKAAKVKALALQVLAEEAGKGVGAVSNLHSNNSAIGSGGQQQARGGGGPSTPGPSGIDPVVREGALKLPSELRSVAAALRTPTLSAGTRKILAQAQQAAEKVAAAVGADSGGAVGAAAVTPGVGSTSAKKGKGRATSATASSSSNRVVLRGKGGNASAATSAVVAVNRAQSQTRSRSHLRSAASAASATPSGKAAAAASNATGIEDANADSSSNDKPSASPVSVGQRSRAQTGVSVAGSHASRPGSEALYANAMGKLQRQKQAIKAADNAAKKATEVKANSKSDALLRQRLGREIAAACVFVAARRALASNSSSSSSTSSGSDGSGETVVPWWLLELSAPEVSDILVHCGFLGEPALPANVAEAAARGIFEWQLPAAARFDGIPLPPQQQDEDGNNASGAVDSSFDTSADDSASESGGNNPFTSSARSRTRSISARRSINQPLSARSRSASSSRSILGGGGGGGGAASRGRSGSRERLDFPPSAFVPVVTLGGNSTSGTDEAAVPVSAVHLQSARLFTRVWDALTWTGVMDRVSGALTMPPSPSSAAAFSASAAAAASMASLSLSLAAAASGGMSEANVAKDGDPAGMAARLQSLQTRVTAVRLLALLQALLTGGYDVRRKTLSACGSDIGLAHPFLTLPSASSSSSLAATASAASPVPAAQSATPSSSSSSSPGKKNKDTTEATQQLPPAFASALKAHSERLRGLSTALFAGKLPPASPPPAPLSSSSASASAAASASAGAGLTSAPSPTQALLAQEVLEGRLLWPINVLTPLQRLYSNRLAYLGNLTRRDTRSDVGIGAAVDVVTLNRKASAAATASGASVAGGLANPLAVQAPAAPMFRQKGAPPTASATTPQAALLSPFTQGSGFSSGNTNADGAFGDNSANPAIGAAVSANAAAAVGGDGNVALPLGPRMSYSDMQNCTFQPMLCKKSMAIAGRQEWEKGGRRAGIGGGVDGTPQGHAIALAASQHKDPNSPMPMPSSFVSGNNHGSGSHVVAASLGSISSAQKVRREVALMEFAARSNARLKHARAQRIADELAECSFRPDLSKGKHILRGGREGNLSSSVGGGAGTGASGTHTPSSAPGQGAGGDLNAHLAANLGLLASSNDGGDASVISNNNTANNNGLTRGELLYSLAALRAAELARARQEVMIARSAAELEGCTFAPQIHASPRARRVARSLASASGPGALSGDGTSGSSSSTGRTVQRGRGENAAFGTGRSGKSKEPIPEALAAALLPRVSDTLGSPGHLAARVEERKRARSLLAELAVAAENGGLAHLGLNAEAGSAAADGAAGNAAAAGGAFPNGMSSHLARMAKSAAQRAQREQLESALSAGVLHRVKERILGVPAAQATSSSAEESGAEEDEGDGVEGALRQDENENNGGNLGSPSEPPAGAAAGGVAMPPSLLPLGLDPSKLAASLPPEALQALAYQALLAQAQAQAQALQQLSASSGGATATATPQPQPLSASVLMPSPSALGNNSSSNNPVAAAALAASLLLRNANANNSTSNAGDVTSFTTALGDLSTQQQQQQQQQRGPPLLFVDVAISPSSSDRIPLWKDTDCTQAAADFASKHGLSAKMQARLAKMLLAQRDQLLASQQQQQQGQGQRQVAAQ